MDGKVPGYTTRWKGLLFIGISVLVISLDNTVLNTAIPSITRNLNATINQQQWVLDGYTLIFAALLLTTGSIGDRFGRKRALQGGLIWFGLVSLIAAFAKNIDMLILARGILGVGGALILPASLSIITATFPPKERPQAIAIWAAIFGLGVGIGPVLGGFLLEHFDWNSMFLINLPTCAVALIGGALFLADSKDEHVPAIDFPGVTLSITGLFALVYGIIEAGVHGWQETNVLVAFGIAFVLLSMFIWWEAHSPNAMLPMRFFRNPSFTGASIAMSFVTFNQFGVLFFFAQYFQTVQGYSTFQGGLRVLPMALTLTIVATLSARVTARLGTKYAVALGIFIAACGSLYISNVYQVDTPYGLAFLGQIILGVGVGMAFSPATNSIMGSVPVDKAGVGSAMNDTTRQLGGALGIAVLGTVLNINYLSGISALKGVVAADDFTRIAGGIQSAHVVAATLPDSLSRIVLATADQAFIKGMSHALLIGAGIMLMGSICALILLPKRVRLMEDILSAAQEAALPATAGDR